MPPLSVYSPVDQEENPNASSEKLLLGQPMEEHTVPITVLRRQNLYRAWPWLMHSLMFGLNFIIFFALLLSHQSQPSLDTCLGMTWLHSPVNEAIEYQTVMFNGTLDVTSPYIGTPSPAVDEAWMRITWNDSLQPIRVSDEDMKKIYKDGRASNVRFSEEDGGGSLGAVDVFHQLHCLNFFRKYTYPDYYPEVQEMWQTRPIYMRYHIDHCVEILRQVLMCNADVGVVTYDWVEDFGGPYPDFNTWHQCRNYDKILEWFRDNYVHIPKDHVRMLGDEVPLAVPPEATQVPKWEAHIVD